MEPVRLFSARSSIWRWENNVTSWGILPRNIFDRSQRILSSGMLPLSMKELCQKTYHYLLEPEQLGFWSSLQQKENITSSCCSTDAVIPVKKQYYLLRLELLQQRYSRLCKLHKQPGMTPDRRLLDRSKNTREGNQQKAQLMMPVNLLLDKMMYNYWTSAAYTRTGVFLAPRGSCRWSSCRRGTALAVRSTYRSPVGWFRWRSCLLHGRNVMRPVQFMKNSSGILPLRLLFPMMNFCMYCIRERRVADPP